jgi:hypothetical protein
MISFFYEYTDKLESRWRKEFIRALLLLKNYHSVQSLEGVRHFNTGFRLSPERRKFKSSRHLLIHRFSLGGAKYEKKAAG